MSTISNLCTGTPNLLCLFIEINNKRTFWPSVTEVVLLLGGGSNIEYGRNLAKYGFP